MNIRAIFVASLLFSLCLTGCARNSVNNDKVAYRQNDNLNPARVNYDNRDRTSDVTDINDPNRANNIRDNDGMVRNDLNNGSRMRVADRQLEKSPICLKLIRQTSLLRKQCICCCQTSFR